jgi:hypothetical protein
MAVTHYLSCTKTREALPGRHQKKHDQFKLGEERITPPAERNPKEPRSLPRRALPSITSPARIAAVPLDMADHSVTSRSHRCRSGGGHASRSRLMRGSLCRCRPRRRCGCAQEAALPVLQSDCFVVLLRDCPCIVQLRNGISPPCSEPLELRIR